jgi:hypothetical protein
MLIETLADFVLSAWVVAVITSLSAAREAVNKPVCVIVPFPRVTAQVTAVFDNPDTVAVNCSRPPAATEEFAGEMLTVTFCGTLTTTSAEADLVASAVLTAVTV